MSSLQITSRLRGMLRTMVPAALKISHPGDSPFPPVERNGLIAVARRDWPDDPNFLAQWRDLMTRCESASVFQGPTWQEAIVDEFVPAGQFRLITVQRDEQLLAVLPLCLSTTSTLESPGKWVSDYLDPLVDDDAHDECWSVILELLASIWDWSLTSVRLHHVRENSKLRDTLPELSFEYGFEYLKTPPESESALHIPLSGSWEDYLKQLDGHERKEIKRKMKNAQAKGRSVWSIVAGSEDLDRSLDCALAAMCQASASKADFSHEILAPFLRIVLPRMARDGDFYINELWIEDRPVSWLLCFRSRHGPMIYNTGYDHGMRHWSPGAVSFALAIQDAIEAGFPTFNLLRGDEDYKKRLGALETPLYTVTLRKI